MQDRLALRQRGGAGIAVGVLLYLMWSMGRVSSTLDSLDRGSNASVSKVLVQAKRLSFLRSNESEQRRRLETALRRKGYIYRIGKTKLGLELEFRAPGPVSASLVRIRDLFEQFPTMETLKMERSGTVAVYRVGLAFK